MDSIFVNKDRRVLPNWRQFDDTISNNELSSNFINNTIVKNLSIEDYSNSFKNNKLISTAGDLISAAYVNGFPNNDIVQDAADFILNNKDKSTSILIDLSQSIKNGTNGIKNIIGTLNNDNELQIKEQIISSIKKLKPKIKNFINNPINYVELSRLYTILGFKEKSINNMKIALNLAPENRFILRSASRLFSHYDLEEYICKIIQKTNIVRYDPWVASAEIALATMINRKSLNIRNSFQIIESKKFSPFQITELASSLGTLEYYHGNIKKTKKLIKESLIQPNDNTLAQFEWINNRENFIDFQSNDNNIKNNYEALALANYYGGHYNQALDNVKKWFLDLPFSSRSIKFGYHIASNILNDNNTSLELLKLGLISHPKDPFLINNISYQFALSNKIKEAEKLLNLVDKESLSDVDKLCLKATSGLIHFRKGDIFVGRQLYHEVMNKTKISKKEYYWLAYLNLLREEILIDSEFSNNLKLDLEKIPNNTGFIQINKLKNEISDLLAKNKI
ncbi:MAG: hypothetical protein WCR42_06875 [bacterium]